MILVLHCYVMLYLFYIVMQELLKILFELVSRQLTDEDVTVKYNKVK